MSEVAFYLGTHQPAWLARVSVPLFVSHRRLGKYKRLLRARCRWALDSGAFTELGRHGRWTESPDAYARAVRRYRDEVGRLAWAAPQDWLCEPFVRARTGLSVREHLERTVENFSCLRRTAHDLPFVPVLQGWRLSDYLTCARLYQKAGVDLTREPLVGVGSICRRQATGEIGAILEALSSLGLRLHGFGVKRQGIERWGRYLVSADSMAWSYRGRFVRPCRHRRSGRPRQPGSEANCLAFALNWHGELLESAAHRASS